MIANKQKLQRGETDLEVEHRSKSNDTVVCSKCNGFFTREYYNRHKKMCMGDSAIPVHSMSASFLNRNDIEETFRKDIMEKFTKDEVGELCMSDPYILLIYDSDYSNRTKISWTSRWKFKKASWLT